MARAVPRTAAIHRLDVHSHRQHAMTTMHVLSTPVLLELVVFTLPSAATMAMLTPMIHARRLLGASISSTTAMITKHALSTLGHLLCCNACTLTTRAMIATPVPSTHATTPTVVNIPSATATMTMPAHLLTIAILHLAVRTHRHTAMTTMLAP
jgi:hypothetical protein